MPPFPTATTASATSHLALLVLLSSSSLFFLYKSIRLRRKPSPASCPARTTTPTLLYASVTGTSKTLATRLSDRLTVDAGVPILATDASSFDPDDLPSVPLLLLVVPTHDGGAPPPSAAFLARWLEESAADFRAGALLLSSLRFAVFGVGSRAYGETFNAAARNFSRWLRALGAVEVVPLAEGDVDGGDLEVVFEDWSGKVLRVVKGEELNEGASAESDGLDELELEGEESDDDDDDEEETVAVEIDMEDIAGKAPSRQNGKVESSLANGGQNGVKEMVTPIIRTSLEKQVSVLTLCYTHSTICIAHLFLEGTR
jgi:tRNA wybutosine-synthesizing protein 1